MSGGTGAVSAGCGGAQPASAEHRSGAGAASQPWPVHSHLPFAALPSAVPCARLHVRSVCLEWGLRSIAETAELLVSELMTNAVQESGRLKTRADPAIVPVVNLWLISDGISLVIHVWDASDEMPVRKDFTADDEGGRGLMLVEALGKEWGTYRKAEGGKVVWVMITSADQ
jgi:anti-sigma regulatory factor (Ser/Thr protein kinase)